MTFRFKDLLEESNLSSRSSFSEFASKHGKDDRFKGVEKMRDRESLFNDHLAEVKRREREEKSALKDKVSDRSYFFSVLWALSIMCSNVVSCFFEVLK